MSAANDGVLIAYLAFATQCVSREEWQQALEAHRADPSVDPGAWLVDRGFMLPRARNALQMIAEERTWRGDPGRPDSTEIATGEPVVGAAVAPAGETFRLGAELGRGGLGRVVEAEDTRIGRTVALKLVRDDAPPEALERFRWEARVTGRLEHPNIVPVHEAGTLPDGREFFCMKRISGRDMAAVIGDGKWSLRRLVEAFRDVCRAVAYAHWKGVIHRDLKPANVMLGDFGEVLVVDWGLARAAGEAEPPLPARRASHVIPRVAAVKAGDSTMVTLDGSIVGTPAYMSPEQAAGRLAELDARSDVWSLGAMLYEILAGRPPFVGPDAMEIAARVMKEPVTPPSTLRACPAELEQVCLKALSKKKEDRYASAVDLELEIEQYLEGTKERERIEKLAAENLARAREKLAEYERLGAEARELAARAKEDLREVRSWEPIEKKREIWRRDDGADELGNRAAEAFAEADALLTMVLAGVPGHAEARRLRAALHWGRFLEAEAAGDTKGMVLSRRVAERHNDGALDRAMEGMGTIDVRAAAYGCSCLVEGRIVAPAEMTLLGYHPWSGRKLDDPKWVSRLELESQGSLLLRVHSAACAPAALPGGNAWAWRYEERDRVLVPVTPAGTGEAGGAPPELLDALFGASPLRPVGPGVPLGRTPVAGARLPAGSWLLVVAASGYQAGRVPFVVKREENTAVEATLFRKGEAPDGFLPVAGGVFDAGDRRHVEGGRWYDVGRLDDTFLARHPVTAAEYEQFLREIHALDPHGAAARRPRLRTDAPLWPLDENEIPVLPTRANAERFPAPSRLQEVRDGVWEPDWPVFAISWDDCAAYARWASEKAGRLFHLPHETQWERAARGADLRKYPWGEEFDEAFCAVIGSRRDERGPEPIESRPLDESPFGIRGMGGNTADFCLNIPGGPMDWRIHRGGSFNRNVSQCSTIHRSGSVHDQPPGATGIRLACCVRLQSRSPVSGSQFSVEAK